MRQQKWYLVTLLMHLGEYEKIARHVVFADDAADARRLGFEAECHDFPDYTDFPEENCCWDMNEFMYEIYALRRLTTTQARAYRDIIE